MKKEDLLKYCKIKEELKQIKEQLDEIEATYTQVRAISYDTMPKSKAINDFIGESLAKIEELKGIYHEKLAKMLEFQIKVERVIDKLESEERILMRKRYIEGLKWEELCEEMYCSPKTAHRMHNKILEKIKDDME